MISATEVLFDREEQLSEVFVGLGSGETLKIIRGNWEVTDQSPDSYLGGSAMSDTISALRGFLYPELKPLAASEPVVAEDGVSGWVGVKVEPPDRPSDAAMLRYALTGKVGGLSLALGGLFALSESYPDLKSNANMMQLSEELTSTENKVAFSRQAYNDSVTEYNTKTEVFPANMIAGMFNFTQAALFEVADEGEREAVKVEF